MKAIKTVLGMSLFASVPAFAQEGGGLSDAETSFTGAVMLTGDIDVTFDSFDDELSLEALLLADLFYDET